MDAPHYTDDTVTLYHGDCLDVLRKLPDASVDAVVTDPPYGLANTSPEQVAETIGRWLAGERDYLPGGAGFMGKAWDAFVPPVAVWDECLRVLKPGGHLLAFAGSRTFDLMSLGVRLAGFDIRDGIAWLYGSGFPKSRDVSEAMERFLTEGPTAVRPGVYEVTAYLRAARDAAGWTNKRIDALFGTNGMAGHWTTQGAQPAVPSPRQWEVLKEHLGFDDSMDALAAELGSTERPEGWGEGDSEGTAFLAALQRNRDNAARAGGWGTALKPAFEPVVVARKPLAGTVAANVLTHGTGALNIDGCRVGTDGGTRDPGVDSRAPESVSAYGDGLNGRSSERVPGLGRWPTNVVLDESQAAELGPEARFFPTFRYEAKAPTAERPKIGDGKSAIANRRCTTCDRPQIASESSRCSCAAPAWAARDGGVVVHPTVKPLDLMRWLVRLVTPPGGVILEPFAGSGTTAEACVVEGFRCIAIEREPDYLPLIVQRLTKPIPVALDLGMLA